MLAVDSISRTQSSLCSHHLHEQKSLNQKVEQIFVFVEMVEIESTSELGSPFDSTVCSLSFGLKSLSIE